MSSPKLRSVTIGAVLFQFSLAVLGEGGLRAYLSHPPLIAVAVLILALTIAALFSEGSMSSGEREDRGNRWVLPVFGIMLFAMAILPPYADRKDFLTLDGDAVRWLGVGLFAAGGVLRLWPVFTLGRRFSGLVAIQPGHTLVTTGIYRSIRNPSYLGMMVNSVGWALAFRSVIGLLLAALLLPPLVARIHAEERLLRAQFGAEYEEYCARSWRLIPGVY
jgi:protein-S-isoprenylcysteine O-methyltransferase Ste14